MTVAYVQQSTEISASATASTTITVTAGSLLVCIVIGTGGSGNCSLSDNNSGVWTQDKTLAGSTRVSIFSAPNAVGGSTQITVTPVGGSAYKALVYEFSGVATSSYVDGTPQSNTNDTVSNPTAAPSPGVSIASGSVALLGAVFDRALTPSGPTGWTGTASSLGYYSYKIFSSGGSNERGAFSVSIATNYNAVLAAYKVAGGGGGISMAVAAHQYHQQRRK